MKTVDEFLKNDRLYQYAMKAYGLEDMIYAEAFMKKVLESNPTDANSFANKLTDKRYRDFAAAFSFTSSNGCCTISTPDRRHDRPVHGNGPEKGQRHRRTPATTTRHDRPHHERE